MSDLFAVRDPLTLKLALFVGVYLVAASSALVRPSLSAALLTAIKASPGIMHATGALAAFVGGGLLVAHADVTSFPAVLVTITSAWWALEGLALLAFGHILPIDSPLAIRNYARSNIPALLIGVVLVIVGLFGHLIPPDHASEAIPR
jgi:hypothetical protein